MSPGIRNVTFCIIKVFGLIDFCFDFPESVVEELMYFPKFVDFLSSFSVLKRFLFISCVLRCEIE